MRTRYTQRTITGIAYSAVTAAKGENVGTVQISGRCH